MKLTEPFYFDFFVPMRPQPLQRARVCKSGVSYTPKESRDAKAYIKHEAIEYLKKNGIEEPKPIYENKSVLRDLHQGATFLVERSGRPAIAGDSPVGERDGTSGGIPSTAGHEKPRGNPGGPSSKAKY